MAADSPGGGPAFVHPGLLHNGSIDDFRIYYGALTAAEVAAL